MFGCPAIIEAFSFCLSYSTFRRQLAGAAAMSFLLLLPLKALEIPKEEPIQLPKMEVNAAIVPIMIPYAQLLHIDALLRGTSQTLRIVGFTVQKHPGSRSPLSAVTLIRKANYQHAYEPPGEPNLCPIDAQYADYFASSNQPNDFSELFLIITTGVTGETICLRDLQALYRSYYTFIDQRLAEGVVHYEAKDKKEFADAAKIIFPDEVVIVAKSERHAGEIAGRVDLPNSGRVVRLSSIKLDDLIRSKGGDHHVANATDVDNVAPWRSAEPSLPVKKYGGTLYIIGWLRYKNSVFSKSECDFVIPGIQNID